MSNILQCPSCAAVILPQEAGEVCPKCRTPLPQSTIETVMPEDMAGNEDVTRLAPGRRPDSDRQQDRHSSSRDPRQSSSSGWLSSSGAINHGRFEPGTFLGGRYRIIERIGRGGMGEVYRADDLKLGQPVALKFLPPDVDRDPARLTQLHTEVRMARQVSHPNVCRVYDIDEIDGTTFLSMEYVDGEDLSSLLKRVGRFPEDRALEIARQICAGLAAAHERDVIHRDLKPANVMLDGTGKVRITDFGLAGASGEAIRAGTPAYMAPEQLSGQEVTARSDIYALGLVLYELFTGQRALDGKNLAELIHKREHSGILPPTTIVKSLDVKIERAILQCLRPQVDERPASALAVAAALPGGDPLAAALAAGETPSPQMVAAAGARAALPVAAAVAAIAWFLVATIGIVAMYQRALLVNRLSIPKPPAALEDRAQEHLGALGYNRTPVDHASGLMLDHDYVRYIARTSTASDRWDLLRSVRPGAFFLWYRTSPQILVPWGTLNSVGAVNPPMTTDGMALIVVDSAGRLAELTAVPSPTEIEAQNPPIAWEALFDAAGLPFANFRQVAPDLVPTAFADERRAWEGPLPDRPDLTVRVEAAMRSGRPVSFGITGPWTRSRREIVSPPSLFNRVIGGIATIMMPALMILAAVLARSNVKAKLGDHQGAFRIGAFAFVLSLLTWMLGTSHVEVLSVEVQRVFAAIGSALFDAGLMWVTYLGLEPYIRRYAPDTILGWTRLLAGKWNDPRVAVDVIIGVSAGLAMTLLFAAHNLLPPLMGHPEPTPISSSVFDLSGLRYILAGFPATLSAGISSGMLGVVGVLGLGLMLRRVTYGQWIAAVVAMILFTPVALNGMFPDGTPRLDLAIGFGIIVIFVLICQRAGLLAAIAALFTHFTLLREPVTFDLSSWHAAYGWWRVGVLIAIGVAACYIASRDAREASSR